MGQYYKAVILGDNPDQPIKKVLTPGMFSQFNKLKEHSYIENPFVNAVECCLSPKGEFYKSRLVWAGDYADIEPDGKNLYESVHTMETAKPKVFGIKRCKYIVNHTKRLFIDKTELTGYLHPLPFLTCEGNGRGGGDYYSADPENLIGSWSRDVISLESVLPNDYTKILFNLQ
jgi:hypothetical protein